jgi:hypothetical protein
MSQYDSGCGCFLLILAIILGVLMKPTPDPIVDTEGPDFARRVKAVVDAEHAKGHDSIDDMRKALEPLRKEASK